MSNKKDDCRCRGRCGRNVNLALAQYVTEDPDGGTAPRIEMIWSRSVRPYVKGRCNGPEMDSEHVVVGKTIWAIAPVDFVEPEDWEYNEVILRAFDLDTGEETFRLSQYDLSEVSQFGSTTRMQITGHDNGIVIRLTEFTGENLEEATDDEFNYILLCLDTEGNEQWRKTYANSSSIVSRTLLRAGESGIITYLPPEEGDNRNLMHVSWSGVVTPLQELNASSEVYAVYPSDELKAVAGDFFHSDYETPSYQPYIRIPKDYFTSATAWWYWATGVYPSEFGHQTPQSFVEEHEEHAATQDITGPITLESPYWGQWRRKDVTLVSGNRWVISGNYFKKPGDTLELKRES